MTPGARRRIRPGQMPDHVVDLAERPTSEMWHKQVARNDVYRATAAGARKVQTTVPVRLGAPWSRPPLRHMLRA